MYPGNPPSNRLYLQTYIRLNVPEDLRIKVKRLARRFKVSTLVILRRVRDMGGMDEDSFWSAYWDELDRLRGIPRSSGGNAIRNVGARVSKRLARALVLSTLEGRTSYTESFRMLGVKKLSTFERVAESLGVRL